MENEFDVVIVGTGFAGLCVAIRLLEAGIQNIVLLERADGVGGTWRDNCYPGAACDVPSNLYSFSFESNPNWTRSFGTQSEILAYIQHCARKYNIEPLIRFNSEVVGATFVRESARWQVRCADGRTFAGRALVSGCGAFSKPALPDIPGLSDFEGDILHTARWRADYEVHAKRIGVIGTGASGIQVVPAIAPAADHLTVFQRTPSWILPKADRAVSARQRKLYEALPMAQKMVRRSLYWTQEARVPGFNGKVPQILSVARRMALRHLHEQIPNDELRQALTPTYDIGCKRILLANDYYPTFNRSNVSLETSGIERGCAAGLVTTNGDLHHLDTIICATGFHIADDLAPFPMVGLSGQELGALWAAQGAEAYLGATIHDFPNLFTVVGPNTGVGHTSMIYMIEAATAYAVQGIDQIIRGGHRILNVRPETQAAYNSELQDRLEKTVWTNGGCVSWYNTKQGKNTSLWPGQTFEYRRRTSRFDVADYQTL